MHPVPVSWAEDIVSPPERTPRPPAVSRWPGDVIIQETGASRFDLSPQIIHHHRSLMLFMAYVQAAASVPFSCSNCFEAPLKFRCSFDRANYPDCPGAPTPLTHPRHVRLKTQHGNMRRRKPRLRLMAYFLAREVRKCVAKLGEMQMSDEKNCPNTDSCFVS